jgi:cytochrome c oxidase assembly protein subunit 15
LRQTGAPLIVVGMDHIASLDALPTRVDARQPDSRAAVGVWLLAVAALVLVMVLVGGATRLTESGLSITQWKPVTGVLPPLSDADWLAEFERYKQIPQFALLNPDMTLDGFKTIFWWEWSHRLLARIVGLVYVLPALWFWARGALRGALGRQVALATALLALEPIVGWWMVSSGLSDRVEVAQERLALHLLIAAGVFGTAIYAAAGLRARPRTAAPRGFAFAAAAFALMVYVQLGLGALVAGLRAGQVYNTWPQMGSSFMPAEAFGAPDAAWNDAATAQFDHRIVGYCVLVFAFIQAFAAVRAAPDAVARRAVGLAVVAGLQVALGILTLVLSVPIPIALAHQAIALVLFGLACAHWGASRVGASESRAPRISAR